MGGTPGILLGSSSLQASSSMHNGCCLNLVAHTCVTCTARVACSTLLCSDKHDAPCSHPAAQTGHRFAQACVLMHRRTQAACVRQRLYRAGEVATSVHSLLTLLEMAFEQGLFVDQQAATDKWHARDANNQLVTHEDGRARYKVGEYDNFICNAWKLQAVLQAAPLWAALMRRGLDVLSACPSHRPLYAAWS